MAVDITRDLISAVGRIDARRSLDRLANRLYGSVAFDPAHLSRVVVVIGECVVDSCHVEVVSIGDRPRTLAALLHESVQLSDANPPAADVRLVKEFAFDSSAISLCHTRRFRLRRQKRTPAPTDPSHAGRTRVVSETRCVSLRVPLRVDDSAGRHSPIDISALSIAGGRSRVVDDSDASRRPGVPPLRFVDRGSV